MTISPKDIKLQLRNTSSNIDQLDELIEERQRLIKALKLSPSNADNMDLIGLASKIKSGLSYLHQDLSGGGFKELASEFSTIASHYESSLVQIQDDPYVNTDEYRFTGKLPPPEEDPTSKKSVRFKDLGDEDDQYKTAQMRNELMGTASNFKPYKDNVEDEDDGEDDRNTLSSVDTSNREFFAQHQQKLLQQDQSLDVLRNSVRIQNAMGRDINEELDDHLILLNDMERGVDGSSTRIRRATNRIVDFRRKVRENGSLVTIIVLTVILILLLVVLN